VNHAIAIPVSFVLSAALYASAASGAATGNRVSPVCRTPAPATTESRLHSVSPAPLIAAQVKPDHPILTELRVYPTF
jgi:hypothetical protein